MQKKTNPTSNSLKHGVLINLLALTFLAGCMNTRVVDQSPLVYDPTSAERSGAQQDQAASPEATPTAARAPAPRSATEPTRESAIYRGTGRFIDTEAASRPALSVTQDGDLVLNFQGTDIREVTKVVLGDMLDANYLIDPEVKGNISLQTSRPVNHNTLLPLYEKMLWMSGAVLIQENELYRIVPRSKANRAIDSPRLPDPNRALRAGYQIYVIPLKYVAVEEMVKILEPFLTENALLHVDERRNLMMLAGTSQELQSWLETVDIFDVDWMQGNSVGLFDLEYVEPDRIIEELQQVLGLQGEGKAAALVQLEPLDRLNAVLAISPQPGYLERVKTWIKRLDRAEGGPGTRLYVYRVKNRKAVDLAMILTSMFEEKETRAAAPVRLAPGARPATLRSSPTTEALPKLDTAGSDTYSAKQRQAQDAADSAADSGTTTPQTDGVALPPTTSIRVMADEQNNAIVVLASAAEYQIVEAALQRLDIVPLQVLIEASIVEVTLTDDLRYGVEWFFKNHGVQGDKTGIGTLDLGVAGIASRVPGFSYALLDTAGDVRAVLNLLAEESELNVLSSPSLMVLDNRTAEIRVGNQVPVRTETAVTEGGVTVESIQFKDTGVLLSVTPGVNTGGLVTMDVSQEVTDVGSIDAATGQRTFLQRNIQSVVAVQSGDTIVLGGLILENESNAQSGVPGLYRVPVVGKLFGQTEKTSDRTELLVLITPRVVRNQEEATAITRELRERMSQIQKWPFDNSEDSTAEPRKD